MTGFLIVILPSDWNCLQNHSECTDPYHLYSDTTLVAEYSPKIEVIANSSLFGRIMTAKKPKEEKVDLCPIAVGLTSRDSNSP